MRKIFTWKNLLIALGVILALGLLIQFIPFGRDHTNSPVVKEPAWDSPQTRALAKRACFDCHSNESVWPWYANIAPVSWLVYNDVQEGRGRLNFSDYNGSAAELGEQGEGGEAQEGSAEVVNVLQRGEMPPLQYLLMHPTARLSDAEKQQLIEGLRKSLTP
jgi:hypothetical protein